MTNEELERVMNFIIERQEQSAARQEQFDRQQADIFRSLAETTQQQKINSETLKVNQDLLIVNQNLIDKLVERSVKHEETLEEHDERIQRFERSYAAIANLLGSHDAQLVTLTDNMNNLNEKFTESVNNINILNEKFTDNINILTEGLVQLNLSLGETHAIVDRLSVTVDRYISARNNGSGNGAS